jgi:hypothetical protein
MIIEFWQEKVGFTKPVLETPEISGRQEIADLKAIILNLGRQIFSKQIIDKIQMKI